MRHATKPSTGEWLLGVGEAVGVMALPIPAVAAHVRDVVLGLPAHHAFGLGGIAPVGGDIAANWCDASKAERMMGWKAQYDIADMCRDSWNWQSHNPNGFADAE